ncbi:amino acid--tRNA ligase-related protein [Amycolatopsis sp. PS_44_ISF1]|uniref:amino acid--tRNA ligase-related protein n=1 Tax=Amycolatopsis sp. PS_44_ISF1 TaxID=2974917 RepID=UPI0028DEB100|nr:amino acid--tRNA ligase-related protein [Amycolatopsis sp. PS_44_ISF1]MDT8916005.1 asparagine ligase [Amycolatopsis sp. PS_44_ISF1]
MPLLESSAGSVSPPVVSSFNEPGAFLESIRSPWFHLIADLHDIIQSATVQYAAAQGLKSLYLPLTTRTVTCPTALGSDSEPVPVTVSGVKTYLADSMQFALEYGCRVSQTGCYNILPSFRAEEPDETHLGQFTHSEAEIVGDLDDLIRYVDGYVKAMAAAVLERAGARLEVERRGTAHLQRMVDRDAAFEQLTFDEAVRIVGDVDGTVRDEGAWRTLTRRGELLLMRRVSEFVWVRHFDSLAVPFYQAFTDESAERAKNADLFFGMGEVVGSGERHTDVGELRKSIALHSVDEAEYDWYVRMQEEAPMLTSGFGMGIERFLMWVLGHHDIRDVALISRVDEPQDWPAAVVRP